MLLGVVDRKIPSVSSEICDNSNRNWRYFTALYETEGANAQNGYGDFVFFANWKHFKCYFARSFKLLKFVGFFFEREKTEE